VDAATWAEFIQFHAVRVMPPVLLRGVRPFPAFRACQVDDDAVAFSLGHVPFLVLELA
jgi:hypothetical protein